MAAARAGSARRAASRRLHWIGTALPPCRHPRAGDVSVSVATVAPDVPAHESREDHEAHEGKARCRRRSARGGWKRGDRGRRFGVAPVHARPDGEREVGGIRPGAEALGRVAAAGVGAGLDAVGESIRGRVVLRLPERRRRPGRLSRHGSNGGDARRGAQDRAGQEHIPHLQEGSCRRGCVVRLRNALPLPGPRRRQPGLPDADQSRCRRRAPCDAARDRRSQRQAAPQLRRIDLGAMGQAPALYRRDREHRRRMGR